MTTKQIAKAKEVIGDRVRWYQDGSYWVVGRIKHTCLTNDGRPSPKHVKAVSNILTTAQPQLTKDVITKYPFDIIMQDHPEYDTPLIPYRYPLKGQPSLPTEAVAVTEAVTEAEAENSAAGARKQGACQDEGNGKENPPAGANEFDPSDDEPVTNPPNASPWKDDAERQAIVAKAFEALGSMVNAAVLNNWREGHEAEWIRAALLTAAEANARSPKYVTAILQRWAADGYPHPTELSGEAAKARSKELNAKCDAMLAEEAEKEKAARAERRRHDTRPV